MSDAPPFPATCTRMNNNESRWYLAASIGIISVVVGGTVLYGVIEDDPHAGILLILGSFIVSMGVTLIIGEIRQGWRRRRRCE